MFRLRALHQRISSVPNLLVNQDRLFPGGNQYITPVAIIVSGLDPSGGRHVFAQRISRQGKER